MAAGLFKIGGCLSTAGYASRCAPANKWGVFKYLHVAERLVICTRRAWRTINDPKNEAFLKGLSRDFVAGNIETGRLLELGLCPRFYSTKDEKWTTFGLRMKEPNDQEYREYFEAEKLVHSMQKGPGRRGFLGMQGMRAKGVDHLDPDSYGMLLRRLADDYKGKFRGEIRTVVVDDIPFDLIKKEDDGTITRYVSKSFLVAMVRSASYLGIEPVLNELLSDALKPPSGD